MIKTKSDNSLCRALDSESRTIDAMDLEGARIPLVINVCISSLAAFMLYSILPFFNEMFIKAGLFGIDMNKMAALVQCKEGDDKTNKERIISKPKIPEAQGVIAGAVYLIVMFLFIPVPFYKYLAYSDAMFPHHEFVDFIAALLSMCCMIFLGFADDVLNLQWRHKILLPTMASLPLLMVYFINFHHTIIIVPKPFRDLLGMSIDLGPIYYIYMGMMAVFCTNAINILAGVNGLEAGQSLIIAISVVIFNVYQLLYGKVNMESHVFSLYLLIPYIAVCVPLLYYNWCPATIFVGDTFCYFSGMAFAVVAILGHFSKTMMLFFIPQVVNFIYSAPQIFKFVPCPRHRLPRLNESTGLLEMSTTKFREASLNPLGRLFVSGFSFFGLLHVTKTVTDGDLYIECNNMTIINLAIKFLGPLPEARLTAVLLIIQVMSSVLAFWVRLYVATYFYDE